MSYTDTERAPGDGMESGDDDIAGRGEGARPECTQARRRRASPSFCLPAYCAGLTLLPKVRAPALSLFKEHDISWHAPTARGPSNHRRQRLTHANGPCRARAPR